MAVFLLDLEWRGGVRRTVEVEARDVADAERFARGLLAAVDPVAEAAIASLIGAGNVRKKEKA